MFNRRREIWIEHTLLKSRDNTARRALQWKSSRTKEERQTKEHMKRS